MKTDKLNKIILKIVQESNGFLVPRETLYRYAQNRGYDGSQERLLKQANLMASNKKIIAQKTGIMQFIQYRSIERGTD